eukprot:scaffold198123_cov43-Prasinocladus_malaysianus.AAC.1
MIVFGKSLGQELSKGAEPNYTYLDGLVFLELGSHLVLEIEWLSSVQIEHSEPPVVHGCLHVPARIASRAKQLKQ